jgi:hypothetical protein
VRLGWFSPCMSFHACAAHAWKSHVQTHTIRSTTSTNPTFMSTGCCCLGAAQGVVVAPVWQVPRQHAVSSLQQQPLCDNFFDPYPDGFQAAYRAGRVLEYVSAGAWLLFLLLLLLPLSVSTAAVNRCHMLGLVLGLSVHAGGGAVGCRLSHAGRLFWVCWGCWRSRFWASHRTLVVFCVHCACRGGRHVDARQRHDPAARA